MMGRYKNYWYDTVKTMLKRYKDIPDEEKTWQECVFETAVKKAIKETLNMPDGELRVKAVRMRYIDNTHNLEGTAMQLNASPRTIQRWCSSFINQVGRHAGF